MPFIGPRTVCFGHNFFIHWATQASMADFVHLYFYPFIELLTYYRYYNNHALMYQTTVFKIYITSHPVNVFQILDLDPEFIPDYNLNFTGKITI